MQGRYGADELFYILTILYIVLMFINIFMRSWVIHIIGMVFFVLAIYRSMSRNTAKRYRENQKVMGFIDSVRGGFAGKKNRAEQNKTHYFKRCPNCGKTLRLPRVKGKHNTKCPACGCRFSVRILRGARTK